VLPSPPVPPTRPPSVDAPAALPRSTGRDAIADLIRGSETTGSAPPPARPAETGTEPQRLVASAQRALVKLGYGPLKTDGIFGQETRQAIARFERDRRLTPTGELGPRTLRELSAQSSIRVE
jgi:peptidoglycan hydrolase-like protein with peptidoglycan-binding domain